MILRILIIDDWSVISILLQYLSLDKNIEKTSETLGRTGSLPTGRLPKVQGAEKINRTASPFNRTIKPSAGRTFPLTGRPFSLAGRPFLLTGQQNLLQDSEKLGRVHRKGYFNRF